MRKVPHKCSGAEPEPSRLPAVRRSPKVMLHNLLLGPDSNLMTMQSLEAADGREAPEISPSFRTPDIVGAEMPSLGDAGT